MAADSVGTPVLVDAAGSGGNLTSGSSGVTDVAGVSCAGISVSGSPSSVRAGSGEGACGGGNGEPSRGGDA